MRFEPVKLESAHEIVAKQIAEAIRSGQLLPGEELPPERELADQFDVGRTTIREALRQLQAEGMLVRANNTPRGRMRVAQPSAARVQQAIKSAARLRFVSNEHLVDLRCGLEMLAVERAAEETYDERLRNERESYFKKAKDALDVMSLPGIDPREFSVAHTNFHVALVGASGNKLMHAIVEALQDQITENVLTPLTAQTEDERSAVQRNHSDLHKTLLYEIKDGRGQKARSIVYQDIMGFYSGSRHLRRPMDIPPLSQEES
jgi:GntR family transcriptional regulator, transcriptional repressor for pyruvate dehydrogenase complex